MSLAERDLALSVQVLQEFYVQAARVVGCTEIISEDLGNGQDYAGIRVINPFG